MRRDAQRCVSSDDVVAVLSGQVGYEDVLAMRDQAWQQLGGDA